MRNIGGVFSESIPPHHPPKKTTFVADIRCLNKHGTLVTASNSTNNNVFFFVSDLKVVYYNSYKSSITMHLTREENILCHYLFGDKIIQNCLKIDATHWYNNDLLMRQETQKNIACPGSWYNNN